MRAAVVAAALLLPAPALGNGAFPDTERVLLPEDRPETIVLATNFGLVITEDGGQSWRWSCEHGAASGGYRYTLARDQRRLIGLAGPAIIASDDLGCRWRTVFRPPGEIAFDFFPDGGDPGFAFALAQTVATRASNIVRLDLREPAAAPTVLYTAPPGEDLTTVESARSDPRVVYATLDPALGSGRTRLLRSADGGRTWAVQPLEGALELVQFRIAAVDPRDAARLYFRAGTPLGQGEGLVLSEDAGKTVRAIFTTSAALAAFLPLEDTALLATLELGAGRMFRLEGGTFVEVAGARLGARAFAERGGLVYAATDNVTDGFALAVSRDRGRTWDRVMAFSDIGAISRCGDLPSVCLGTCAQLVGRAAFDRQLCELPPAADAGADAAGTPGGADGGCSCRLQGPRPAPPLVLVLVLVLGLRRGPRPS